MKLRAHPGIINLFFSFQDTNNLYFVLEFCPNGDFFSLIRSYENTMPLPLIQHYAAEMVYILENMHRRGVAHRDFKPENLLLDPECHLRLTDFGTAKDYEVKGNSDPSKRTTFVGTAQYVSPEVLGDEEAGGPVDLWALGCTIYQMFTGKSPFRAQTDYLTFEKIKARAVDFDSNVPEVARDLIMQLLTLDPHSRLGAGPTGSGLGFESLKSHQFFSGLHIDAIYNSPVPFERNPVYAHEASDDEQELAELNVKESQVLLSGVLKKKTGLVCKK